MFTSSIIYICMYVKARHCAVCYSTWQGPSWFLSSRLLLLLLYTLSSSSSTWQIYLDFFFVSVFLLAWKILAHTLSDVYIHIYCVHKYMLAGICVCVRVCLSGWSKWSISKYALLTPFMAFMFLFCWFVCLCVWRTRAFTGRCTPAQYQQTSRVVIYRQVWDTKLLLTG